MKDDSAIVAAFGGAEATPNSHPVEDGSTIHLVERSDEELRAEQMAPNPVPQPSNPAAGIGISAGGGFSPFFAAGGAGSPNMIFHSMNVDTSLGAEQMSSQIAQSLMGAFENALSGSGRSGSSYTTSTASGSNTTNTNNTQQSSPSIFNLGTRIPTPTFTTRSPLGTSLHHHQPPPPPPHTKKTIKTATNCLKREILRLMDNIGLESISNYDDNDDVVVAASYGPSSSSSSESSTKACLEGMAALMDGLKKNLLDIASTLPSITTIETNSSVPADWSQIHNTILVLQEISPSILCLKRLLSSSKARPGNCIQIPSTLEIPSSWLDDAFVGSGSGDRQVPLHSTQPSPSFIGPAIDSLD